MWEWDMHTLKLVSKTAVHALPLKELQLQNMKNIILGRQRQAHLYTQGQPGLQS